MIQQLRSTSRLQKIIAGCGILFALFALFQIYVMNSFQEPADDVFDRTLIQYDHNLTIDQAEITFSPKAKVVEAVAPVMAQKPSDESGVLILEIRHGDQLIFRGSRPCSFYAVGDIVDFPVRLTLDPDETYTARLFLGDTELPRELLLCGIEGEDGEIQPLIYIQCASNLSLVDKLLMTLYVGVLLAFFLAAVYMLPIHAKKILSIPKKMNHQAKVLPAAIAAGIACWMALEYSGAVISVFYKLLMAMLVFLSTQWLLADADRIEELASSKHQLLYVVLSLLAAFGVVGNKLLLQRLYLPNRPIAVITFLIVSVTFYPVIVFVESFLRDFSERYLTGTDEQIDLQTKKGVRLNKKWALSLFIVLLTLISFLFYLRAFNPAVSSPDSTHCMYYAINPIKGIDDWHPAFYILWLKAIVKICPAAEAVVLVQFVFFAYVMIRMALFLQEKRIPQGLLYTTIMLIYLNVANMLHLMTIWKDIPYTLSILWLTVTLARIFFGGERHIWFSYLELIVSLVWTCLFRHPGIVVFIIVCAAIVLYAKKNVKMYALVAVALALVVLIKGPVYAHYDIQTDHGGGVYIGLGADIMGVYYNNGELSEEAVDMVNQLAMYDLVAYTYQPRWSNASYDLNVSKAAFIKAYIDTFLKNPQLMTKCIIARMGYVWDVFKQDSGDLGTINFTMTMDQKPAWNELWNQREVNFFTWKLQERLDESVDNELLNTLEWRCGLYFLLALSALGSCRLKRQLKAGFIVFLPVLAHVLSLALSTGWSEFRYVWPIQLMAVFLVLFTMCMEKRK